MRFAQNFVRVSAVVLGLALIGGAASSQTPTRATTEAVKVDPKRAERYLQDGDDAVAAGRFDEALAAYDQAAKYAPQDISIVRKGALLRAQLVQAHTDNAEQFALNGDVVRAIAEFHAAMRIDPANAVVAERMAQVTAMREDESAPEPTTIRGLPKLNVHTGKHNLDLHGDTR